MKFQRQQESFLLSSRTKGEEIRTAYIRSELNLQSPVQLSLYINSYISDPKAVRLWTSVSHIMRYTVDIDLKNAEECLQQRGVLDQKIATVTVSLWPFDTPEAAIRGILTGLTRELAKHVNTLSITGIGSSYVHAIESAGGTFKSLAQLLQGSSQPDDVLQGIEDIAIATGVRFILWLEDVERFAGAEGLSTEEARRRDAERLGAIRALLFLLDQRNHISVVIVDASLQARFDVEKISRFVDTPPRIRHSTVLKMMTTFRDGSLSVKHIDPTNYDQSIHRSPSHRTLIDNLRAK